MKISTYPLIVLVWLGVSANVMAGTTLSTRLHKPFRELAYPHAEKIVGIAIETKVDFLPGNKKTDDLQRAGKIHELLVGEYKKAGWREDELEASDFISKNVEIVIGEGLSLDSGQTLRLKAFVNQCLAPMRKYRGGDLRAFFDAEVVGESEYCVTYDNQLEYDEQKVK